MKILGISGGNGVILHPLKKWVIGNIEPRAIFKTPGDIQWKLNFGDIPIWNKYIPFENLNIDHPHVIIGAPDCGHSSMFALSRGKKFTNPKDNKSVTYFLQAIDYYQPRFFVMENLPKMLELVPEEDFKKRFPKYLIIFHVSSVKEFGNSQINRNRLLVIGIKKNTENFELKYPNLGNTIKTCKELLKGVEDPILTGHIREGINSIITLYARHKMSLQEIQDEWLTIRRKDKRWKVYDRKFSTAPGVYRNRNKDYPATARKINRQFNHVGLMMSPRELARIQGIPDDFKIWVDPNRITYCINKGRATVTKTPPYEIGVWFMRALKQYKKQIKHRNNT